MTWFNTYDRFGEGLIRREEILVDLTELPLSQWTLDEVGWRLAYLFPLVDGYGDNMMGPNWSKRECTEEDRQEIRGLQAELERRGYDPIANLQVNERNTGWGWLNYFYKKDR